MSVYAYILYYTCIFIFFPFSGQPCISDDEVVKEIDLPEIESDSGCPQPLPPENGFIRVSILIFRSGVQNIKLKKYACSFIQSYYSPRLIIFCSLKKKEKI